IPDGVRGAGSGGRDDWNRARVHRCGRGAGSDVDPDAHADQRRDSFAWSIDRSGPLLRDLSRDAGGAARSDRSAASRKLRYPHAGRRPKEERERKPLTAEDGQAIQEGSPAVKNVTVWITWWEQTHSVRTKGGEVTAIDFRGVQPNFGQVYANAATLEGRFISEGDDLHKEKVVMLGENVAPVLFPGGHAVGQDVMIDGSAFMVIGVVEKAKGGFGMGDADRRVLIPFSTFRKTSPMADEINFRMQARPKMLDQAVDQAREVLERRRRIPYGGKDNFSIETAEQQVQEFHNIMLMTYVVMIVLSAIGLLIGGVGVMNIMLVSVTERTREIGVRKAIGARRGDITWQFLLEAMTLTGAGGVIALILTNRSEERRVGKGASGGRGEEGAEKEKV